MDFLVEAWEEAGVRNFSITRPSLLRLLVEVWP